MTWKTGAVTTALSRHGLSVDLAPMQQVPLNARRRATLAFVMTAAGPMLGFKEAYSDRIVGMDSCPLLAPPLAALWVPLREFCGRIFQSPFRADLRVTTTGAGSVDIVIEADAELDLARREAIAAFAEARDVARVSWQRPGEPPEPVVQRKPVLLNIGRREIELPMGGFVQPSTEGERSCRRWYRRVLRRAPVADLYCGIGTFAFVLSSDRRHVLAVDDNAAQIAALDRAAGRAGLGGYIDTAVRTYVRRTGTQGLCRHGRGDFSIRRVLAPRRRRKC